MQCENGSLQNTVSQKDEDSTPHYIYVSIKMVITGDELCPWIEVLLQNRTVI